MKRSLAVGVLSLVLLVLVAIGTATRSTAEGTQSVFITNFPELSRVDGVVAIRGPIEQAVFVKFEDKLVTPVNKTDPNRFIAAGEFTTGGHSEVVLSMNGLTKGSVLKSGYIGFILVPAEIESISAAQFESRQIHFPLEVSTEIGPKTPSWFAATPVRLTLGFPKYRILMYNNTDAAVTLNLYANLIN
ncbi:MAG: hypothetical protein U0V87_07550 [Acidobacteriota bacterium]